MRFTFSQKYVYRFLLLLFVGVTAINFSATAQFERFPLPVKSTASAPVSKSKNSSARTKELIIRNLPFWDDFSTTPVDDTSDVNSNFPLDSMWRWGQTARINNGLALNPPSINVATFDGLDSLQRTYSSVLLENGRRDKLESQGINLAEPAVTLAERNSVYLSFFYQWQGNGEAPDPTDYLGVEFRNSSNTWETVLTITPKSSFDRSVFYDTLVKVDGERFFHGAFQFRFVNYGRKSGPYDTWNVDYVYLNKNRSVDDTDFPDQAITSPLTSLFNSYLSIPYHHFLAGNTITSPTYNISNNLNDFSDLTYLTEGTFYNYRDSVLSVTYVSNLGGNDTSAIGNNNVGIILPLEKKTVTLEYVPNKDDNAQFNTFSDSVFVKLKVKLFTGDTFDPKHGGFADDYNLNYRPIDFRVNDTISSFYRLKDYYAYDDGIAEYSAGLTQPGNRAAVLFEMLTGELDTLIGFDVYVPDYGLASNTLVDFVVYSDNDGLPGDPIYTAPSKAIERKGANVFQRISIERKIVGTRFYIGWRAPVGPMFKIGLDYNNNSGDKVFVNVYGSWEQTTDITGSLMIRPVFGSGDNITSIDDEIEEAFALFPNPNSGDFFVQGRFDKLEIITVTGQKVPFELQDAGDRQRLVLSSSSPGLYILKIHHANKIRTSKFVVK